MPEEYNGLHRGQPQTTLFFNPFLPWLLAAEMTAALFAPKRGPSDRPSR